MTVEEIFSKLASHMIKGMMVHEQMANYYDFLGLKGYKRCHEYHFLEETCAYRKLCRYFINHYNKLIPESRIEDPKIIPDSWFRYTRQDVDNSTKKNAVKIGLAKWEEWEKETKELYEEMYLALIEINDVAGALYLSKLICNVTDELKKVERYSLNKKAIDYDLSAIISEQKCNHEKYKMMTHKVGKGL